MVQSQFQDYCLWYRTIDFYFPQTIQPDIPSPSLSLYLPSPVIISLQLSLLTFLSTQFFISISLSSKSLSLFINLTIFPFYAWSHGFLWKYNYWFIVKSRRCKGSCGKIKVTYLTVQGFIQ